MTELTVIMSVHNGARFLAAAIDSILQQTYRNFEFIIVDDHSDDDTPSIIDAFEDARVKRIRTPRNMGLTYCLNLALSQCSTTFVARQDADDISHPERLARQLSFLRTKSKVAVVGSQSSIIDDQTRSIRPLFAPEDPGSQITDVNPLIHGSVMFRRAVIEEVGSYDNFFRFCQDHELWLRVSKSYELANLPDTLYCNREHRKNTRFSNPYLSALFQLLILKIARGSISDEDYDYIRKHGITKAYSYLDRAEKAHLHKAIADSQMRYGSTTAARSEYWKVIRFENRRLANWANLVLAWLGKPLWRKFHT